MVDKEGTVHTVQDFGMSEITDTVEYAEVKGFYSQKRDMKTSRDQLVW